MKQKLNKTIQKIALILICILSLNFIAPTYVSNADVGGVLESPIKALVLFLGDSIDSILGYSLKGRTTTDNIRYKALNGNHQDEDVWSGSDKKIDLPIIEVTPEDLFSGKILMTNIDFINKIEKKSGDIGTEDDVKAMNNLRSTIAAWYVALRNFALVVLLSVLVYTGIRILVSSTAGDKAKYKEMLKDWIIGICLLFLLHYIMAFVIDFTKAITDMIASSSTTNVDILDKYKLTIVDDEVKKDLAEECYDGNKLVKVPNIISYARLYAQLKGTRGWGYTFIYLGMIICTLFFGLKYLKRVIMMAFLTVIAPLVAMTYSLDKMHDGQAQAFNMWIKEYVFTALIQPFHLILYALFGGMSVDLAKTNPVYAVVCFSFILTAEKILKDMFGFDKKRPLSNKMNSFATGATAATLASAAKNIISNKKSGNNKSLSTNGVNESDNSSPIHIKQADMSNILGSENNSNSGNESQNTPVGNENNFNSDNESQNTSAGNENNSNSDNESQNLTRENRDNSELNNEENNINNELEPEKKISRMKQFAQNHPRTTNIAKGAKRIAKAGAIKGVKTLPKLAKYTMAGIGTGMGFVAGAAKDGTLRGALTGAAAGGVLGKKAGEKVQNGLNNFGNKANKFMNESWGDTFQNTVDKLAPITDVAKYGDDKHAIYEARKQREKDAYRRKINNDIDFKNKLEEKTGYKDNESIEQANDYRMYGISDDDAIKSLEYEKKLITEGMDKNTAHTVTAYAANYLRENKNHNVNNTKDRESAYNSAMRALKNNKNLTKEQKENMANKILDAQDYITK